MGLRKHIRRRLAIGTTAVAAACSVLPAGGCQIVGLAAVMAETYKRTGKQEIKAEYTGLVGKSFAVIVATDRVLMAEHPRLQSEVTTIVSQRLRNESGASGYVLKASGAHELLAAVHVAAGGETYVSPRLARSALLATEAGRRERPADARDGHVRRELATLGREAGGVEDAVDAPLQALQLERLLDPDPQHARLAAQREMADPLEAELERHARHQGQRLGHLLRPAVVELEVRDRQVDLRVARHDREELEAGVQRGVQAPGLAVDEDGGEHAIGRAVGVARLEQLGGLRHQEVGIRGRPHEGGRRRGQVDRGP